LAPTEPTDNVLIAYAAGDGTTASDGDGRNSPFTTALLRHIETPGLEISFLFRRVRDDVMAATKREQQPFVYGSLSKEEIYLKAPAISTPVKPATDPTATASTDDEKFWQAIQTSTVAGLFEEYLSRYPRGAHVTEARQRIKDLAVRQVSTAPADSTSPQPDSPPKPGSAGLDGKPSDRNLYTADDARKVAAIGATQQLVMPAFSIDASVSDIKGPYAKFVGVWSSKAGWGKGAGRHAMVIILGVSATGSARGYYLWGPPTKQSWVQDPAGNHFFAEHIENDKFSIPQTRWSTPNLTARTYLLCRYPSRISLRTRRLSNFARSGSSCKYQRPPNLRRSMSTPLAQNATIAKRHHPRKKLSTDQVRRVPLVDQRWKSATVLARNS
jgi:Caspase domain